MIFSDREMNGIKIISGENDYLKYEIAPAAGGKFISIYNKLLRKEFLWHNEDMPLELHKPGDDYDSKFYGGIDELIPNDIPENINSISYPDHGELWTTPLECTLNTNRISVCGKLKMSGLFYEKSICLAEESPEILIDYRIRNESGATRSFLWKLHAALKIAAGDRLITNARKARVVDPQYSRFENQEEFSWPILEGIDVSMVPVQNGSMDFYYLYDISQPVMKFICEKEKCLFSIQYDKNVFPFQWYFASFGGFLNHYTAILEPCTSMPLSVNDAIKLKQCTVLEPGQEIATSVRIYAGENI